MFRLHRSPIVRVRNKFEWPRLRGLVLSLNVWMSLVWNVDAKHRQAKPDEERIRSVGLNASGMSHESCAVCFFLHIGPHRDEGCR